MLFSKNNYHFMFAALQEAEKAFDDNEVPVGAVVVLNDKIIGRGYNQVEKLKDPTAHAEMIAITASAGYKQDWRLNDCDIYVTMEPCLMCAGALLHSRIRNLYFSVYDPKFGACGSRYNVAEEGRYNHKINVFAGIYSEESKTILKKFFGNIRLNN